MNNQSFILLLLKLKERFLKSGSKYLTDELKEKLKDEKIISIKPELIDDKYRFSIIAIIDDKSNVDDRINELIRKIDEVTNNYTLEVVDKNYETIKNYSSIFSDKDCN